MEHIIVEREFADPVSDDDLKAMESRAGGCYERLRVTRLRSYCSRDRRRMICEYLAPDAESVRKASERAGIPFVRAWTAEVLIAGE